MASRRSTYLLGNLHFLVSGLLLLASVASSLPAVPSEDPVSTITVTSHFVGPMPVPTVSHEYARPAPSYQYDAPVMTQAISRRSVSIFEDHARSAPAARVTSPGHLEQRWVDMCNGCEASIGVTSFQDATRSLTDDCHQYPRAKQTCVKVVKKIKTWVDNCYTTVTQHTSQDMWILWIREEGFAAIDHPH